MAKPFDFSNLSLDELNEVIDEVTVLRDGKIDALRKELMAELERLDAVTTRTIKPATIGTRDRAKPQPKYRSKIDPDLTWVGRGGQPRWLTAEMAATGLPLDHFLIK